SITQIGKPPPLAVRLEQALPFRRCVGGEDVLGGSPASQTTQKPQAQYHGEARSSGVVPCRVPSLNEECALMHPLQGASFLSTPLQGGILKPPALRVVGDWKSPKHACCHARGRAPLGSVPTMAVACASSRCPARASPGVPHACARVPTSVRGLGRTGGAGQPAPSRAGHR